MYTLIEFPEIQAYQDMPGFKENACLANDIDFLNANNIGSSAYFVDVEWLNNAF